MHLLIIHEQLMVLIKIWKTTIQQRKESVNMFLDTIADIESNKKLCPVVTELFLRGRKLNISLVFISQSHFKVTKTIRLNTTHFIMLVKENFSK